MTRKQRRVKDYGTVDPSQISEHQEVIRRFGTEFPNAEIVSTAMIPAPLSKPPAPPPSSLPLSLAADLATQPARSFAARLHGDPEGAYLELQARLADLEKEAEILREVVVRAGIISVQAYERVTQHDRWLSNAFQGEPPASKSLKELWKYMAQLRDLHYRLAREVNWYGSAYAARLGKDAAEQ